MSSPRPPLALGWMLAFALPCAPLLPLSAQERSTIPLKEAAQDFALNPETGDLAAIHAEKNTVTLYRAAYFDGDRSKIAGPITVGSNPVSIVFKRYRDKAYYCVACLNDSYIHVIDATE